MTTSQQNPIADIKAAGLTNVMGDYEIAKDLYRSLLHRFWKKQGVDPVKKPDSVWPASMQNTAEKFAAIMTTGHDVSAFSRLAASRHWDGPSVQSIAILAGIGWEQVSEEEADTMETAGLQMMDQLLKRPDHAHPPFRLENGPANSVIPSDPFARLDWLAKRGRITKAEWDKAGMLLSPASII